MAFSKKLLFDYSLLPLEERLKKARDYLVWILARRDYARITLEQKLRDRKLPPDEIDALLDLMVEQKLYDPDAYFNLRVRSLFARGYAPLGIVRKLSQQRIKTSVESVEKLLFEEGLEVNTEKERFLEKCFSKYSLDFSSNSHEVMKTLKKIINKAVGRGYHSSDVWEFRKKLNQQSE
jgi:SOS response regulatory protein OraA/RecX